MMKEQKSVDTASVQHDAVKPRLWSVKLLYFFFFAGQGIFFTFVNVYYNGIGLTGIQIGLLNTVGPLVGMISSPIWGMISDRTGKTRRVLLTAVAGVILASLALSSTTTFVLIVPIVAVFALFNSTIMPLIDSTTLSLLGDHRERYGAQRVWGTIGFMITSAGVGIVLEQIGLRFLFVGYAITMAMLMISLVWLPERRVQLGTPLLRGMGLMVRQPHWLLFVSSLGILGLATAGMSNFLSLMVKQMGGSDSLIGIMWTIAAIVEAPVMLFSAPLLRRFGARNLIVVAIFAYALRMLLYGFLPAPEWAAAVNMLGGLSFGLYWISAVTYANELAPDNLKATSQGLLVAVTSLSMMLGAIFSGWLYDLIGPFMMFRVLALCCVVAGVLYGVGRMVLNRRASSVRV